MKIYDIKLMKKISKLEMDNFEKITKDINKNFAKQWRDISGNPNVRVRQRRRQSTITKKSKARISRVRSLA